MSDPVTKARGAPAAASTPAPAGGHSTRLPASPHPAGAVSGASASEIGPGAPPPAASAPAAPEGSPIGRHRARLRFRFRETGVEPALRLGLLALRLTLRHAGGAVHDRLSPGGAPDRARARLERSARDAVAVLGSLKGVFAKLGQFASTRPDLVPAEGHAAFETLRDRVPPMPFSSVRAVIEAELGRSVVDCFARIGHRPIGAASVAQVHRAWLHDGTEVAVKVQYPWLRHSIGPDLRLVRRFLRPVLRRRGVEPAAFDRLFDEFAAGLEGELDFEAEALTAARIAANLADDEAIVVPRVHPAFSTGRVLTLDHVDGVPIESAAALEAAGASPRAVVEIVTRAYARQVFVDGLFHADPHPGNLLALPNPDDFDRPRVGFLDFGLSRQLSPELRSAIRQALFSVLKRDPAEFVSHMQALDMISPGAEDGVRAAVDVMFERMGGGVLQQSGSAILGLKDDAKTLLRDTPGLQLPNDLLLYAKTLSHLFHLGDVLAPDVDLMKLAVPHLLRFLAERDEAPAAGHAPAASNEVEAPDGAQASGSQGAEALSAGAASRRAAGPATG